MRNAYDILSEIRDLVGETSAAHWTNRAILRKMNRRQNAIGMMLTNALGDWLLTRSSSQTPSSSQVSLPSDCMKPAYVEEVSSGRPIPIEGTVRERRFDRPIGATIYDGKITAYVYGSTLFINQDNYTEPVYIWYQQRLKDMHCGDLESGASSTALPFELAMWPHSEDDYYNGLEVEVMGDLSEMSKGVHTITDYAGATGIATVAAMDTAAEASDYYGTVSQLPLEAIDYLIYKVGLDCIIKPSSTFDREVFGYMRAEAKDARKELEEYIENRVADTSHVRTTEYA